MSIEYKRVKLTDLHEDPANARLHPDENLADIRASLKEFGQVEPLVVQQSSSKIIGGNGRYKVMKELGWTECDVAYVNMDNMKATALGIALNRAGERAEWDSEVLDKLLAELDVGEELSASLKELEEEVGIEEPAGDADAEPQIDKAAELQKKWGTETGQLWLFGEHRLLCGDSTKREDVERVMGGERACCIFTDPPYGVSVGAKNRLLNSVQPSGRCLTDIASDDLKPEELEAVLLPAFVNCREIAMADDCTLFMTAPQGGELGMMMMMMMQKAGLKCRHVLIWKKNSPTFSMGRLDYDYQHEPILLTWLKRHKRPMGGTYKTSVWEIDKPRASAEHPTMKPVELYVNGYLNNSDTGDVVYEPYSGSGTAFVAAQNTKRLCRGIELEPNYCAVILERMAMAFPALEIRQA